jgi:hypothetical protein
MTCSLPHHKNERQQSVDDYRHFIMKYSVGCAVTESHNQTVGHLSIEQRWWQYFYYVLKMSVNRVSMTFGLASWKIHELCGNVTP